LSRNANRARNFASADQLRRRSQATGAPFGSNEPDEFWCDDVGHDAAA
jgi:hypothetical protein